MATHCFFFFASSGLTLAVAFWCVLVAARAALSFPFADVDTTAIASLLLGPSLPAHLLCSLRGHVHSHDRELRHRLPDDASAQPCWS